MQLEQTVFLVEILLFLLVDLGYLLEHISSVLIHFEFDLFFCLEKSNILSIFALQILGRLLFFQVFAQDF